MNKYVLIAIGAFLIVVAFTFQYYVVYGGKPTVVSTWESSGDKQLVLTDKVWEIEFSEEMDENSVASDSVFVTNAKGEKVDLSIQLRSDKKAIIINPPKDGYSTDSNFYTLHVEEDLKSVTGQPIRASKTLTFSVSEDLPVIGNEKNLQAFFQELINREKKMMKEESKFGWGGEATEESSMSETTSMDKSSSESPASGGDFTDTNVQVQGVDEADIVKTDGTYIYQVIDRQLKITKAFPTANMETVATVPYNNFDPFQLFVDGDKLVVIGSSYQEQSYESEKTSDMKMMMPIYQQTKIVVYDITDRTNPKEVKSVEVEGSYVTSRKIDSTIYFLNSHYPDYWILEREKDVDLRPKYKDTAVSKESQFIDYKDIRYIPESKEANYSIMTSFDIEQPEKEVTISTYLGSGNDVYMTKENLYMAVAKYADIESDEKATTFREFPAFSVNTEVFKFAVNGLNVDFLASGTVQGRILNQFSMDEYEGYFRIATTEGDTWNEQSPSSNSLYVLDQEMKQVGSVEDLARGERIYSVRFMGEKAYVVTFKEVDPLFVIDVSNPTKPTVLGELKIPGFSNYLHPYDENHLIGFGQNTKLVTMQGEKEPRVLTDGVKISMFDVTDPLNPKEKFSEIIGGRGTYSPLNYDHKALLFNREKNIFAFPISIYKEKAGSEFEQVFEFQGALAYSIDLERGFKLEEQITHEKQNVMYEDWENQIMRVLNINDHLYAVSPKKITSHKIDW
ncbi:beta-propeller domain-containing protein [Bacillus sp. DJP31]|uniref:beta-propeller domain-containing protein n=1 Tax=Bacillus sp. DJP31 TaxID=3409789 RepID=UPI003BB63282